jgi:mannose-6-phosphate isomerase-like protein (cupin superfamily)
MSDATSVDAQASCVLPADTSAATSVEARACAPIEMACRSSAESKATAAGLCWCAKRVREMPWSSWRSTHPDGRKRARQATEWIELTKREGGLESLTGLTQGVLRLQPNGELPLHHHPAPFSETYFFTRGGGTVNLGKRPLSEGHLDEQLEAVDIEPGLHVDIPAGTLHGIDSGEDGCEFIWTFAARKWTDIPYVYVDEHIPDRNVKPQSVAPESLP